MHICKFVETLQVGRCNTDKIYIKIEAELRLRVSQNPIIRYVQTVFYIHPSYKLQ